MSGLDPVSAGLSLIEMIVTFQLRQFEALSPADQAKHALRQIARTDRWVDLVGKLLHLPPLPEGVGEADGMADTKRRKGRTK